MIIGIEGGLGSGKSLFMTRCLYNDSLKGFDIYANYGLNFPHSKLDIRDILESSTDLQNISIGLDEITVFIDCRTSISKMNRLISYFILQTRKRNVSLYYTTQDFMMVDKRLTNHTHIQVICESLYRSDGSMLEDFKRYTVFDKRDINRNIRPKTFMLDISPYYDKYDTNEIILPPV